MLNKTYSSFWCLSDLDIGNYYFNSSGTKKVTDVFPYAPGFHSHAMLLLPALFFLWLFPELWVGSNSVDFSWLARNIEVFCAFVKWSVHGILCNILYSHDSKTSRFLVVASISVQASSIYSSTSQLRYFCVQYYDFWKCITF